MNHVNTTKATKTSTTAAQQISKKTPPMFPVLPPVKPVPLMFELEIVRSQYLKFQGEMGGLNRPGIRGGCLV